MDSTAAARQITDARRQVGEQLVRRRSTILVTPDGESLGLIPRALVEKNARPGHGPCNGTGLRGTLQTLDGRKAAILCRCTFKRLVRLTDAAVEAALQAEPVEELLEEVVDGPADHGHDGGPPGGPAQGA